MRDKIFKLVGRKTKTRIKLIFYSFWSYFSYFLARVFATKTIAFLVTYVFGDRGRAFLGRMEYGRQFLKPGQTSYSEIRRDIHRIEKGLVMKPRRRVFGIRFLYQMCSNVAKAERSGTWEPGERKWALDVLTDYFDAVDHTEEVKRSFMIVEPFLSQEKSNKGTLFQIHNDSDRFSPAIQNQNEHGALGREEFVKLIRNRRSVRNFTNDAPMEPDIRAIFEAASTMPSACNRLPYRYIYVRSRALSQKMLALSAGTSGWAEAIPASVVVVGDFSKLGASRDENLIFIDASLSVGAAVLAAEAHGYSTCVINWPNIGFQHRKAQALLGLEPYERVIMQIAIGRRAELTMVPFSHKKVGSNIIEVL